MINCARDYARRNVPNYAEEQKAAGKMTNDWIYVLALCALYLALFANAGQTFENKVAQLLRDEPENIKCFSERMRDLTCFWEEEMGSSNLLDQYTFTYIYQYQNENSSVCAVSELPMQGAGGKRVFLCSIPQIQFFEPLHLCVFQGERNLYNRTLLIDQVLFLDPPTNLTVVSTGKQGELNVSWRPPAVKYIDDSMMYDTRYVTMGSPMRKEIVKASTKLTLRGLQSSSKYKVFVRVKPDGITYNGYWSTWTEPEFGTTSPSDMDPLIVVLVLIISLIFILLSLAVLWSYHKFILMKLWPDIPSPEHRFPGLFTIYKGDFQEWLGQSNGSRWPVHMYTEELSSPLEVLSEVSVMPRIHGSHTSHPRTTTFHTEDPQVMEEVRDEIENRAMDAGFLGQWQEPSHTLWLKEQLRTFEEHPEVLSMLSLLESQDTYVTLNQNSQNAREEVQREGSLEETLPLQVLFDSKGTSLSAASHSDIGSLQQSSRSGRLSSQSSFEFTYHMFPPKEPGYTYMAVADSGVSMDYSPMSASRISEIGNGTIYANEYKNDILGHRRPLFGQCVHSG